MAFEPCRDVPAVLDREVALRPEAARPGKQRLDGVRVARHGPLRDLATGRDVERYRGVGLHMRVDADYDHHCPPAVESKRWGSAADTP
jgi:hypothetical protein